MHKIKGERGQVFFEKQFITNQLLDDKTPQEIWDIGPEKIKKIYQFACDLYDEKRYNDAVDLFLLLTTLDPKNVSFWKGLGFSSQQQLEFSAAALAYECALSIDPRHAELYPFYLKTLCELNRREQALNVLNELMDQSFDDSPGELEKIRSQAGQIVKTNLHQGG